MTGWLRRWFDRKPKLTYPTVERRSVDRLERMAVRERQNELKQRLEMLISESGLIGYDDQQHEGGR